LTTIIITVTEAKKVDTHWECWWQLSQRVEQGMDWTVDLYRHQAAAMTYW